MPAVRSAALEGLAQLDSPRAVELGIAALDDDVWQVRASAVLALKEVRRDIGQEARRLHDLGPAVLAAAERVHHRPVAANFEIGRADVTAVGLDIVEIDVELDVVALLDVDDQ